MKTTDFGYNLPPELIAQEPLLDRTSSRLLVLDKATGEVCHRHFYNIIDYLNTGDCIVLNDTRVIPARLIGERKGTGARVEVLLLKRINIDTWEVLVYPGKKAKIGYEIVFGDDLLSCKVIDIIEDGKRIVEFSYNGVFESILDTLGEMPLPPYITHKLEDKSRYQTVYAKFEGSAAAPTAGLHFTNELLEKIKTKGVKIAYVTLHVGLGTFRPVKAEEITDHIMHSEYYNIDESNAEIINNAKRDGKKIVPVGTTSTRVLESCSDEDGFIKSGFGETSIFIYPGYKFKAIDSLITNFHLPESTLIMLVSALAGRENVLNAYNIAVKERYRFFSFGDAMLIK